MSREGQKQVVTETRQSRQSFREDKKAWKAEEVVGLGYMNWLA